MRGIGQAGGEGRQGAQDGMNTRESRAIFSSIPNLSRPHGLCRGRGGAPSQGHGTLQLRKGFVVAAGMVAGIVQRLASVRAARQMAAGSVGSVDLSCRAPGKLRLAAKGREGGASFQEPLTPRSTFQPT